MRDMVTVREIPIGAAVTFNHGPMMQFRGGESYGHDTHLKYDLDGFDIGQVSMTIYLNPTVDRAIVMDGWYSIVSEG